jgi:hypothetical protein
MHHGKSHQKFCKKNPESTMPSKTNKTQNRKTLQTIGPVLKKINKKETIVLTAYKLKILTLE